MPRFAYDSLRRFPHAWRLAPLALLPFLILAAGCGNTGPKTTVTGKIGLKGGEPVAGTVWFHKDGKKVSGAVNPDGITYKVDDPPVGACKISIEAPPGAAVEQKIIGVQDAGGMKEKAGGIKMGSPPPRKYTDPETSGLTFTVKAGKNEFNIVLE